MEKYTGNYGRLYKRSYAGKIKVGIIGYNHDIQFRQYQFKKAAMTVECLC